MARGHYQGYSCINGREFCILIFNFDEEMSVLGGRILG
jgi:hypothetical protein